MCYNCKKQRWSQRKRHFSEKAITILSTCQHLNPLKTEKFTTLCSIWTRGLIIQEKENTGSFCYFHPLYLVWWFICRSPCSKNWIVSSSKIHFNVDQMDRADMINSTDQRSVSICRFSASPSTYWVISWCDNGKWKVMRLSYAPLCWNEQTSHWRPGLWSPVHWACKCASLHLSAENSKWCRKLLGWMISKSCAGTM